MPHYEAVAQVAHEVERYKASLEKNHIRHKLLEETVCPDGSVLLRLIKQYNQSPVGSYLD